MFERVCAAGSTAAFKVEAVRHLLRMYPSIKVVKVCHASLLAPVLVPIRDVVLFVCCVCCLVVRFGMIVRTT